MGKLESEVHEVQNTFDTIKYEIIEEVKQIVSDSCKISGATQSGETSKLNNADTISKKATNEMHARINHKNNIVMFNVTEQYSN